MNNVEADLLKRHSYRHVVVTDGRVGFAPCPREQRYWRGVVLPQWLSIARALAEENCLGGVTMENETYNAGTIYPGYWDPRKQLCFCDDCFTAFLREQNVRLQKLPEATRRWAWIRQHGYCIAYERFMEEQFAAIIASMVDACRKIHPYFLVAQYPYFPGWFCDAIIRATGGEDLPTILFSHIEYYSGYSRLSAGHQRYLKQKGYAAKVLYAGGQTVGFYFPVELAMNLLELNRQAQGWWVYWGGSLLDRNYRQRMPGSAGYEKLSWEYRLQAEPQRYWQAIERGLRWFDGPFALKPHVGGRKIPVFKVKVNDPRVEIRDGELILQSAKKWPKPLLPQTWIHNGKVQWRGLRPQQIDSAVRLEGRASVRFGPYDRPGRSAGLIERTVHVPPGSKLLFSCRYRTAGPDDSVYVGFGKLNWYDLFVLPGDTNGRWRPLRVLLRSKGDASLLIDSQKKPNVDMTVRVHVKPTPNTVWITGIKLEPVEQLTLTSEAFEIAEGEVLASVDLQERNLEGLVRLDVLRGDGKEPLVKDYQPSMRLRALAEAFSIRRYRAVLNVNLTASHCELRLPVPRWVVRAAGPVGDKAGKGSEKLR